MDSVGRKGGLALMWKEDVNIQSQSFSINHMDALVFLKGFDQVRFSRFYDCLEVSQ